MFKGKRTMMQYKTILVPSDEVEDIEELLQNNNKRYEILDPFEAYARTELINWYINSDDIFDGDALDLVNNITDEDLNILAENVTKDEYLQEGIWSSIDLQFEDYFENIKNKNLNNPSEVK